VKILGISGFENAVPFKKKHWPNLEEREYRISQGHDSAAVLLIDGELIAAAAEERFSRKKHTGSFPSCAIAYCLSEAGLSLGDRACLALADAMGCPAVTADRAWSSIDIGVSVVLIR